MRKLLPVVVVLFVWLPRLLAQAVDTEWTTSDIANLLSYELAIKNSTATIATNSGTVATNTGTTATNTTNAFAWWVLMLNSQDQGRAQMLAELNGGSWAWGSWTNSSGLPVYTGHSATPGSNGMLNTFANSSQRTAIGDGTKYTIWRELDEIRLNTSSMNVTLSDMDTLLADMDYLLSDIDYLNNKMRDAVDAIETNTGALGTLGGKLDQIITNTQAIDTHQTAWQGSYGTRTWAYMSDLWKTFMENPTPTQVADGFPTATFSTSGRTTGAEFAMGDSVDTIAGSAKGADLPGPLQVPSDASYGTSAPVWEFTFPFSSLSSGLGVTSVGDYTMTLNMAQVPTSWWSPVKAFVICFATWGAMSMVWEEVRRYG